MVVCGSFSSGGLEYWPVDSYASALKHGKRDNFMYRFTCTRMLYSAWQLLYSHVKLFSWHHVK